MKIKIIGIYALLFVLITYFLLKTPIVDGFYSGWVRGEYYFAIFIQIIFFMSFFYYFYHNNQKNRWVRKYIINISIFIWIYVLYWYAHSYDPSIPTLAALEITEILLILPFFLVLEWFFRIIRYFIK